jgi:MoxR-like ATPase
VIRSVTTPGPELLEEAGVSIADFRENLEMSDLGDRRDGKLYRYTPDIKLAVRVALAVSRPLLVFGPSGCGKSSLVFNLARVLGRRYYEFVVHSRSEARDLYYRFDAVRRLGEAQVGAAGDSQEGWRNSYPFIDPGPLWWVYSPATAKVRGSSAQTPGVRCALDPGIWPPEFDDPGRRSPAVEDATPPAVLLIDEIDKADPDFPNNLLVPLGSRQFLVEETGDLIRLEGATAGVHAPLVIITSNRERELPVAFIRRCVVLEIAPFSDDELVDLAKATFRENGVVATENWRRIAEAVRGVREYDQQVSPAEYLDTVRAIDLLGVGFAKWKDIILRTAWTSTRRT